MASVTRSTRRTEGAHHHPGLHTRRSRSRREHHHGHRDHDDDDDDDDQEEHHHHRRRHPHRAHANGGPLTRSAPGLLHRGLGGAQAGARRTKRGLDATERDLDALRPKKARIAVEILAKASREERENVSVQPPRPRPSAAPAPQRQQPVKKPPTAAPPAADADPDLTKHQAKVINGIKAELDRLQPRHAETRQYGRKLRSQEATRFKSELSAYFPEYDEVIGNDPKEQHILNIETPIVLVDSNPRRAVLAMPQAVLPPHYYPQFMPHSYMDSYPVRGYGDALFTNVHDSQRIDFSFLEVQYKNSTLVDPLPDSVFEPSHKRAERLERSIRNSEKGRAQHEKDQIIRLLEGLQGPDWLRVMGVSGITESRKKTFEPAREHFVKGCRAILEKFRTWNLEEKRRKLERDRQLAEQAHKDEDIEDEEEEQADDDEEEEGDDAAEDEEDPEEDVEEEGEEQEAAASDEEAEEGDEEGDAEADQASQAATSDASSPAKQLREEALARSRLSKAADKSSKKPQATVRPTPPQQQEAPTEFKSFFSKKHERDGALSHNRRTGRKVLAWGHPIPEVPEADFVLPEAYRDDETMRSRARKKRRDKRGKP